MLILFRKLGEPEKPYERICPDCGGVAVRRQHDDGLIDAKCLDCGVVVGLDQCFRSPTVGPGMFDGVEKALVCFFVLAFVVGIGVAFAIMPLVRLISSHVSIH